MTESLPKTDQRKRPPYRSLEDRVISWLNNSRYALTEPLLLRLARLLHARKYRDKNESPLISVYIPTYNRAELLATRSIPSVLNQTYSNLELLVLGDHCTDSTEEVVRSFNDSRLRFFNIPSRKYRYPETALNHWLAGPVVAANTALSMLNGKWIARIDDDDKWTPDHIESLLRFAQQEDFEFVSSYCLFERFGKREKGPVPGALDSYYTNREPPPGAYNPRIGGTQTWLYRSYLKFFKYNINCWRKNWNRVNDIDISIRMFNAGVQMGFLDKVTCEILPRPGEETVGFDAYISDPEEKEEHFKFRD
ncbi:MAG: glycosyltransferase family 2 protein [SAR324 cluster bacterium]|uniref:Glycosyltransferase family 2 protein n=1 Tax=SAR324 cluster bacterium TaxID=2024889 RepID=A0A7X9FR90_9DELT|nr:glycosyltransferase family 2 protein [SAR324 cluster bacterium]